VSVADAITNIWPTTEATLTEKVPTYGSAKQAAIEYAIALLWSTSAAGEPVPGVDEVNALSPLVVQYIAELAVLHMIPLARDFYMDGMLSQSLQVTSGAASGTETFYDKVAVLDRLEGRLRRDIEARSVLIGSLISPTQPATDLAAGDTPQVCDVPGLASARTWLGVR
jgi:hypothetical protein